MKDTKPTPRLLFTVVSGTVPILFSRQKVHGEKFTVVDRKYNKEREVVEVFGVPEKQFLFEDWLPKPPKLKTPKGQKIELVTNEIDPERLKEERLKAEQEKLDTNTNKK